MPLNNDGHNILKNGNQKNQPMQPQGQHDNGNGDANLDNDGGSSGLEDPMSGTEGEATNCSDR
jgi:hypothetical protein